MQHTAAQILNILDDASAAFTFPMLDNGYVYLAATRLSLFRSQSDWAFVIEVFGYSPRAGLPDTNLYTFASQMHDRDKREKYVSGEAYENYLRDNPHNESRFIYPIEEGPWMDPENPEMVAATGELEVRGKRIRLPSKSDYATHGINLGSEQPAVFELCRYLAATERAAVLATPSEQRISVLPEMTQILQLDEWAHPDLVAQETPSQSETFQQLAKVLVTGDTSLYRPSLTPNTHWRHWPEGGSL